VGTLGIRQADEPALVEAFVPKPAVESFDEAVLYRLPRLDASQRHAVLVRPLIEGCAATCRFVVTHDDSGSPRACATWSGSRTTRAPGNERSTAMTSNKGFEAWGEILGDDVTGGADRPRPASRSPRQHLRQQLSRPISSRARPNGRADRRRDDPEARRPSPGGLTATVETVPLVNVTPRSQHSEQLLGGESGGRSKTLMLCGRGNLCLSRFRVTSRWRNVSAEILALPADGTLAPKIRTPSVLVGWLTEWPRVGPKALCGS
jgi:hypothetical protein